MSYARRRWRIKLLSEATGYLQNLQESLDAALEAGDKLTTLEATRGTLREITGKLHNRHQELLDDFYRTCEALHQEANLSQEHFVVLEQVLAMPWVRLRDRQLFRIRRDRFLQERTHTSSNSNKTLDVAPTAIDGASVADFAAKLCDHLSMVDEEPAENKNAGELPGGSRDLAKPAVNCAGLLANLPESVKQLTSKTQTELRDERNKDRPLVTRRGLAEAEASCCTQAAPLASVDSKDTADVVTKLRKLDLHNLLVWHATRNTDDFLAREPGEEQDYFAKVSEDLILSAEKLFREAEIHRQAAIKLLAERRLAAGEGFASTAAVW